MGRLRYNAHKLLQMIVDLHLADVEVSARICPDSVGTSFEFARPVALFAATPLRQQLAVHCKDANLLVQFSHIDDIIVWVKIDGVRMF